MLVDTHCHIHDAQYPLDANEVLSAARQAGVDQMICVGTDSDSSRRAVAFAAAHDGVYAAIGIHPHEAKDGWSVVAELLSTSLASSASVGHHVASLDAGPAGESAPDFHLPDGQDAKSGASPLAATRYRVNRLIAIGEIGLDYFYLHSPRDVQIQALRAQIDLALAYDLPIIFHVRDAFDDFWPIFDGYDGKIRGVLHSFTDSMDNMQAAIDRGLYIGVNGISTFTKDVAQQATFAAIPLDALLFETDAPFLTPVPLRGKVNEPAFVKHVAQHHATIRGLTLDEITEVTTANAHALFAL